MSRKWLGRWVGEFIVIVLGVLVALAVNDWNQFRSDRTLEAYLLERMASDLHADAADLALAQTVSARRLWLLDALSTAADKSGATPMAPDSLVHPQQMRALLRSVGRTGRQVEGEWRPLEDPLFTFYGLSEFDLSDDAFQEMLAAGALQVVRDPSLRSSILAYYRTAKDMGENARRVDAYEEDLQGVLSSVGIALGNQVTFEDLASAASQSPQLTVEIRRARYEVQLQLNFFGNVDRARVALETRLKEAAGVAS